MLSKIIIATICAIGAYIIMYLIAEHADRVMKMNRAYEDEYLKRLEQEMQERKSNAPKKS